MEGPWRILVCPSGEWCDECHRDADDGYDLDPDLYVNERKPDGKCICCGGTVVAGNMLDTAIPEEVVSQ